MRRNQYGLSLTNDEVFTIDSTYNRSKLKGRIIKGNLIPYVCASCGNEGEWNGKPLSLQLDHENGINTDNRISNLRFLCPNCHTQTDTYAGKATKGKLLHHKKQPVLKRQEKLEKGKALWEEMKHDPDVRVMEWGWKTRLAKKVGITGQKAMPWLRRVDPEFAATLE